MARSDVRNKGWAIRHRRGVVAAHRWLSLIVGLWVVAQGLSGAVLAMEDLINAWARPALYHHGGGDVGASAAAAAAREAVSHARLATLYLPQVYRGVYVADVATRSGSHRLVFVDPSSAHVNGVRNPAEGFTHWVERWHGTLLQTGHPLGLHNANQLVGIFGAVTLVTVLFGVWLWYWPGVKRWVSILRVRRRRGRMTFHRDVHRTVGIITAPVVVMILVTGLTLKFGAELRPVWYRITGTPDQGHKVASPPPKSMPILGQPAADLDALLADARAVGGTPLTVSPAARPTAPAVVVLAHGLDPAEGRAGQGGNRVAYLDAYTGKVLHVVSSSDKSVGGQVYEYWAFPLHGGTFAGPVSRTLWVVVGLSPLVMAATGVTSWLIRRRKRARVVPAADARPSTTTVDAERSPVAIG